VIVFCLDSFWKFEEDGPLLVDELAETALEFTFVDVTKLFDISLFIDCTRFWIEFHDGGFWFSIDNKFMGLFKSPTFDFGLDEDIITGGVDTDVL